MNILRNLILLSKLQWITIGASYLSVILFSIAGADLFIYLFYSSIIIFGLLIIAQLIFHFEHIKLNLKSQITILVVKILFQLMVYPFLLVVALLSFGSGSY